MILVRNVRLEINEEHENLVKRIAKKLNIKETSIESYKLIKKSLDARDKGDIHYICSVAISVGCEEAILKSKRNKNVVSEYKELEYDIPVLTSEDRPVVVGFGPAGMFSALVLSRAGLRPIVIERGPDADTRIKKVSVFQQGGKLDVEGNIQFGEGGAGTFSDGKLNTGIHDKRLKWVINEFYSHGANENVLYDAKPHIGTDVLVEIVKNIRKEIINNGGEVRFNAKFVDIITEKNSLKGIKVIENSEQHLINCNYLILAIGHSARDTFEMLLNKGISMEQKPFSMGVRIEHLQKNIDMAQYGRERGELPPADYSLNVHLPNGTSAYTFCMCPGGYVFAAASEENGVVTNGMSYSKRDGENSNAALLVTLHPEDFPDDNILSGMYWQRSIEKKAFEAGGSNYYAPAQLCGDFLNGIKSDKEGNVKPTYLPGVKWCNLEEVLPKRITSVLKNAIPELGKKLKGFDDNDAVLTAPETRSSSPVRILREKNLESHSLEGLYPCGEGAGYAGGISSAAVDGVRCAEALIQKILSQE